MHWIVDNVDLIGKLTWAHLVLSIPPIIISFLIALPLAQMANRYRVARFLTTTTASLLYTIPSLPLFIFIPVILGIGVRDRLNVIIALSIYGLALMVRSAADALDAVPSDARSAAVAIGYAPLRRFLSVELPLAGPGLIAGVRVVAVSTIALVSVSGVLGIPSLGLMFTDGFQRGIIVEIVVGIVLTVLLALVVDAIIVGIERLMMPWNRVKGSA